LSALAPHALGEAARRWQPTPAVKATLVLHAACAIAFVLDPAGWPWILALLAGNHAALMAASLCPRSQALGRALVRLPRAAADRGEVALTFDDGPDPDVTPRVLDLLDRHRVKATFFCVGSKVRAYPEIVKDIVRRGHAVENHSDGHVHAFAMLGPWRAAREITAAQDAIEAIAGVRPRLFRPPMGFRNPWLDPLLAKLGLSAVAWSRRGLDTVRRDALAVTRALTHDLEAGDVLLLHDGGCGRTDGGEPMVLAVLPAVLETLERRGLASVALRTALQSH